MSAFTIDNITQEHIKLPVMDRDGSLMNNHQQQQVEIMFPNLESEARSFQQNISPEKNDRISSPLSSTSSSPRTPESQGGVSPDDKPAKPDHSYIALIAMAILDSNEKRLLLCDIYLFIQKKFPYYRNNDRSWRNSIRHNLSLNECFIKCGRSGDGRGNFWGIHPANINDFARGDYRRRRARRRVRAAHDLSYLYHPYSTQIAPGSAYSTAIPPGFVPMSYASFPPYSMVPPAPFYPPPVSVPFTIPHAMKKEPVYSSAVISAASSPMNPINSVSAPVSSSSIYQLRTSPDQSGSQPASSSPDVFPISCERAKTLISPTVSNLHISAASSMFPSPYNVAAPTSLQFQTQWDRAALYQHLYSA